VRRDTLRLTLYIFYLEEAARADANHPSTGQPLTEADRLALLTTQVRQRQEAAAIYRQAGRSELAEKEAREATILQAYLPTRLTDEEIRQIVSALIATHGSTFKTIMPLAAKKTRGRADGEHVRQIVQALTS
jgi:uncharacterized protein YqeY